MTTSFPPSPPRVPPSRLNGWKEIAAHFGKGVRTVQRWEKTLDLPVHRMATGRGEIVYALVGELDAWRAAAERTSDLTERPGERDPGEESAPAVETESPRSELTQPSEGHLRHRWLPAGASLLAAIALAAAFIAWRPWRAAAPADWRVGVDSLHILDYDGAEIWTHRFEAQLSRPAYHPAVPAPGTPPVVIEDLDRNGSREVVFGVVSERAGGSSQIVGFDADGRVRFSDTPVATVQFGDTIYGPPWIVYRLFVTDTARGRAIWVAWIHETSGNFPCLLQRRSPDGKVEAEYWSAGYVTFVRGATIQGRRSILVGAVNNDHKGASLAAFDEDRVTGSAPAEDPDKICRSCAPGGPKAFQVYPSLEFLRLVGGIPSIVEVRQQATGEFRIFVTQGRQDAGDFPPPGGVWYDLAPDLLPVRAEISADFIASHRRLELAGKLDHAFRDAERREVWPVLVYDGNRFVPVSGPPAR